MKDIFGNSHDRRLVHNSIFRGIPKSGEQNYENDFSFLGKSSIIGL